MLRGTRGPPRCEWGEPYFFHSGHLTTIFRGCSTADAFSYAQILDSRSVGVVIASRRRRSRKNSVAPPPPVHEHVACRQPHEAPMTRCEAFPPVGNTRRQSFSSWRVPSVTSRPAPRSIQIRVSRGSGTGDGSRADRIAQFGVIAPLWRDAARERTNAVHAGRRAPPRDEASACSDRRGIFREKYWQPRERSSARTRTAAEASRRDYVPSWMLPDCRRPGSNYTCSNYGGLPRKEQAIHSEPERRLLCVKGAPRCGGARFCAPAANARMRVKLRAHGTRDFESRARRSRRASVGPSALRPVLQ